MDVTPSRPGDAALQTGAVPTSLPHDTRLTLVTCYPFDAIRPGGPLRYVVVAQSVEG